MRQPLIRGATSVDGRRRHDVAAREHVDGASVSALGGTTVQSFGRAIVEVAALPGVERWAWRKPLLLCLPPRLVAIGVYDEQSRRPEQDADVRLRPLGPPASHVILSWPKILVIVTEERSLADLLLLHVAFVAGALSVCGRPAKGN